MKTFNKLSELVMGNVDETIIITFLITASVIGYTLYAYPTFGGIAGMTLFIGLIMWSVIGSGRELLFKYKKPIHTAEDELILIFKKVGMYITMSPTPASNYIAFLLALLCAGFIGITMVVG